MSNQLNNIIKTIVNEASSTTPSSFGTTPSFHTTSYPGQTISSYPGNTFSSYAGHTLSNHPGQTTYNPQPVYAPSAPVMLPTGNYSPANPHMQAATGWSVNTASTATPAAPIYPSIPQSVQYQFTPLQNQSSTTGFADVNTPDNLNYQWFPVSPNGVTFRVRAAHDAHLALTSFKAETNPMLEVFIGGWVNTKSVIRKNRTKPDVVEVETPYILSYNEFRGFWIRWANNVLTVGKEGDPNAFMTYKITETFPINFVGVCTGWGATGTWKVEVPPAQPVSYNMPVQSMTVTQNYAPAYSHSPIPVVHTHQSYSQAPPTYQQSFNSISQHSWVKSYGDRIPSGAFEGGRDLNGEVLFVGRAEHKGSLTPGKVLRSHGGCLVAWGGEEHRKQSYEVLVGNARWIPGTGSSIPPNAIKGGRSENGETLFIGRAHHKGSLTVGKVQPSHGVCYISFGGKEVKYSHYEILVE